ncbi:hypothetical protein TVAG_363920 [Trichomonas vaginalis G3]|uniref:Uncharacterized protein n=1 Tax=Trichomonas vaginalis (strain ATCC PRA-98 / G3) TaxID=412133 RepID=A2EDW1_TRIV3|nr:hypothetical protein TVAGG3_0948370 [Trichomonas vaginalis G3]EAY09177.1 hypothetical protein TVAG_363920 [Trichomonas vaginalis G3]KAI5487035.1 hypothetical protein TVAGG3_0948370 [Trichomonas vaginalis G3]|eukprot:XP_001321400.1 hypothetical protein [Trichomonas vaginalis G3]
MTTCTTKRSPHQRSQQKTRAPSQKPPQPKPDVEDIELVGYKPSEYRAFRQPTPLRGRTAPVEHGSRDIFKDHHTPIQITKKFSGDPILSVPIRKSKQQIVKRSILEPMKERDPSVPIHEFLFEESIDPHENIDPWGYTAGEKINHPEAEVGGIKIKISRLEL